MCKFFWIIYIEQFSTAVSMDMLITVINSLYACEKPFTTMK